MEGDFDFWTSHVEACRREGSAASVYARRHGLTLASAAWRASSLHCARWTWQRAHQRAHAHWCCAAALLRCCAAACGLRPELAALPSPTWLLAFDHAHAEAR